MIWTTGVKKRFNPDNGYRKRGFGLMPVT